MPIDNNYPLVTLAAPIRNRQEFLPYYLDAILKQTFPLSNLTLLFAINNNTDQSEIILQNFKTNHQDKFMKIRMEKYDRPNIPEDKRDSKTRQQIYSHLAEIRNYIIQQVKTPWLFSVDSDIILLPHSLEQLLKSGKKCISALICNGHEFAKTNNANPYDYTNIMYRDGLNRYKHVPRSHWNGIIKVNMTGAVYLLHSDIFKKCRYRNDIVYGEDIPFSQDVEKLGESLWCDTDLKLPHCMSLELLDKYLKGEYNF